MEVVWRCTQLAGGWQKLGPWTVWGGSKQQYGYEQVRWPVFKCPPRRRRRGEASLWPLYR
jgi:hypothetical protein